MAPARQLPARAARALVRRALAAARADGAQATGLARLVEMHAVSTAGDALVAIGLAGSLFFGVPVGQARTKVALYLALTMAPFAVLAPVIGPALDRIRRGRRAAIGTTLVARAVLAALLAEAVAHADALQLYPAAFGLLVLSKAYGVARSSAVPRLLPAELTLVRANARIALAGLVLASIAAPVGGALGKLAGPSWPLLLAAAVYIAGAVLSFGLSPALDADPADRLEPDDRPFWVTTRPGQPAAETGGWAASGTAGGPAGGGAGGSTGWSPGGHGDWQDDSGPGWQRPAGDWGSGGPTAAPRPAAGAGGATAWPAAGVGGGGRGRRRLPSPAVLGELARSALIGGGAMRWLNGFLTVFLAFLLRSRHGVGGLGSGPALGLVVAAAAVGGLSGTVVGARLRSRTPMVLSLGAVAAALAACVAGLAAYGLASLVALGLVTGVTQAVSKLALDSLIQREVPEEVRSSAFSVSESTLQLGWVAGGLVGIVLPLVPAAGMAVATAMVAAALGLMLRAGYRRRAAAALATG